MVRRDGAPADGAAARRVRLLASGIRLASLVRPGSSKDSAPPWAATWSVLAGLVDDMPDNANRRFEAAAALNRRRRSGPGPFWGCPPSAARPELSRFKAPGFPHGALAEYR